MYKGIVKVYREGNTNPEPVMRGERRLTPQDLPKKDKQNGLVMEVTVTAPTIPSLVSKMTAMMATLDEDD